jgi:hypothetical protein
MKIKHFVGEAEMGISRGISDYALTKDRKGARVAILRGTFTKGELRALVDAIELENDSFEFPETIKS